MNERSANSVGSILLQGVSVTPGIGVGTVCRVDSQAPTFFRIQMEPNEVEKELARFREAVERTGRQLRSVKEQFEAEMGAEHAHIIDAHILMLEDSTFLGEIEGRIREHLDTPEKAVQRVADEWLSVYASLRDPYFRERGSDFEEVAQRLLLNLTELSPIREEGLPCDVVLAAPEIGLSALARFSLERVKGMVVTRAGKTAHVAIIARSYGIPIVSGIEDLKEVFRSGDPIIVDGDRGIVRIGASPQELQELRSRIERRQASRKVRPRDAAPCETRDGKRIAVLANTEVGSEVTGALDAGAEGIGLFRSEYLFMKRQRGEVAVDEDEQYEIYRDLAARLGDRPAIIRTLDVASEPHRQFQAGDEGGALGLRGIRFSLKFPEIFQSQVRAILRAGREGNLKIVLPMVTSADEVHAARSLIDQCWRQLRERGVEAPEVDVGIMIEVPSAVMVLDSILKLVDFAAIGTNDLIQYLLAVDRNDDEIAEWYNPLHPAVLAVLKLIADKTRASAKPAIVCGEAAAHPVHGAILIGLGFTQLSMSPPMIPEMKAVFRSLDSAELEDHVRQILRMDRISEVENFVRAKLHELHRPTRRKREILIQT
ncbi:MAG TPA: phosphoenolpyruvate--protein phosphotransferase [Acidobacteriota bacterium]|nr:phosphoenolpyruvate--protein phosphotransferase [Acidobacteriota bacterium]